MDRVRRARHLVSVGLALVAFVAIALVLASRARATRSTPKKAAAATAPAMHPTPFTVPLSVLPPRVELAPTTLRVLVLGDSVASFLGLALRYRQDEADAFVASRGVGQCSIFEANADPAPGEAAVTTSCSAAWARDVAELQPDATLIVLGGAFLGDQACDAAWLDRYAQRLEALATTLGAKAGRVILARVPYPLGAWRHSNILARVDCFDGMLDRAAAAVHWDKLDLMAHVCPTRACVVESQGQPIRPDGLHFDGVGAEETARWTLGELRRVTVH